MAYSLRARFVLPVGQPAIEGGWVTIEGDRIVAVGREAPPGEHHDLGDMALLPGLINAHTHLDLSNVETPLGQPGIGLVDWLGKIVEYKFANPSSWTAVERGLRESARLGTTTVVDMAQQTPVTDSVEAIGIGLVSLLELIAPSIDRVGVQVDRATDHLAADEGQRLWCAGLSPHAPYSVHPDLLSRAVGLSSEHHATLAMHLAESREELELIEQQSGPLRTLLEGLGIWGSTCFAQGMTTLSYLETLATAHRALVVHGNYLGDREIAFLADRAERMSVVYCPRSHAFFGHDPYPLEKMLAAGVTVALGTDSRASSPDLSVLAEMRNVFRLHPDVPPETIVRLATADSAKALGTSHRLGTIEPGRQADLTAVSLSDVEQADQADPYRWLLAGTGEVVGTWCRGRRV